MNVKGMPRLMLMPLVAWGCERALLCQRLDENARRLTNIFDPPSHVMDPKGVAALP
jgi:hypothetical protein